MKLSPRFLAFAVLIPILVVLDLGVKEWAQSAIATGSYRRLWAGFGLTHGFNPGISFSLLEDMPQAVLVITGIITTGVLTLLAVTRDRRVIIPLGLIAAGGLANFMDRVNHGAVTDIFVIGARQAPLFTNNLADFFITFGVVAMIFVSVKIGRSPVADEAR